MFKKNKKNKTEEFETSCIVFTGSGFVEVNQAAYDYIRELERKLTEERMPKLVKQLEEPHILYKCDRKGCNGEEGCGNPECYLTTEIEHAVNFHKVLDDFYEENCVSPEIERLCERLC